MLKVTLKARILILLLVVVSVSIILMSLVNYYEMRYLAHKNLDQKTLNLATILSENIGHAIETLFHCGTYGLPDDSPWEHR